ncbi:MAG: hpaE, partial [Nocardioidaceae bacterium]|nr:hpaE [Nocardioidaceae bacterium]
MTDIATQPARLGTPDGLPAEILHYIGGRHLPSRSGRTFADLDPVSNQPYADVAAGDDRDVAAAVEAATTAFRDGPWPRMLPRARARVLHGIADEIDARDELIAAFEAWDTGLPISQARGQAHRAAENFRF